MESRKYRLRNWMILDLTCPKSASKLSSMGKLGEQKWQILGLDHVKISFFFPFNILARSPSFEILNVAISREKQVVVYFKSCQIGVWRVLFWRDFWLSEFWILENMNELVMRENLDKNLKITYRLRFFAVDEMLTQIRTKNPPDLDTVMSLTLRSLAPHLSLE